MRRLTISMILALALLPAGVAVAKQPVSAKVCGPSDCRTVKDRQSLAALTQGGPPTDPPSRGTGWYAVRITIAVDRGRNQTFPLVIAPGPGLMRAGDASQGYTWMLPASADAARRYREITRGLAAFPAGALKHVGRPRARVDEVVPPPAEAEPGGGSSPLPWIGGGVVLLGLAGLLLRRRGPHWPKPAQG
jgi:MYXO-CTERM domain-containing protein